MRDNFYEKYAALPFLIMAALSYPVIMICVAAVVGAVGYWLGAGFWTPALAAPV